MSLKTINIHGQYSIIINIHLFHSNSLWWSMALPTGITSHLSKMMYTVWYKYLYLQLQFFLLLQLFAIVIEHSSTLCSKQYVMLIKWDIQVGFRANVVCVSRLCWHTESCKKIFYVNWYVLFRLIVMDIRHWVTHLGNTRNTYSPFSQPHTLNSIKSWLFPSIRKTNTHTTKENIIHS